MKTTTSSLVNWTNCCQIERLWILLCDNTIITAFVKDCLRNINQNQVMNVSWNHIDHSVLTVNTTKFCPHKYAWPSQKVALPSPQVFVMIWFLCRKNSPDSKVHGTNMGTIWGQQDPDGPHVGPMDFAIWEVMRVLSGKPYGLRLYVDTQKSVSLLWNKSPMPGSFIIQWVRSIINHRSRLFSW